MNTNEISPITNPRMNRIKVVSRIAKYGCFIFLAYSIGFFLIFLSPSLLSFPRHNVEQAFLTMMLHVVLWVWYWKLTQLFNCYERGLIFAAETIHCIKFLGLLCVVDWMIALAFHFAPQFVPHVQSSLPAEGQVTAMKTSSHHFQMGFFSFDFGTGINFGPLWIGMVIVLIAWIMDEGRKIQEEQELTV